MFRHKGDKRTPKHDLRIASFLSFVAGMVNVAGFLAVQRLTTNVTGHFAFFVDEVFKFNLMEAFVFFLYILFFLLGSFTSNTLVEILSKVKEGLVHVIPIIIESAILFWLAIFGEALILKGPDVLACALLFAMGLQNSLVTKISNAAVRTTHLTGLFTDLGIELSQLFFYKLKDQKQKLFASIKLRMTIISFFLLGGILGGIMYTTIHLYVLAIAGTILLIGLSYDYIKTKLAKESETT